MRKRKDVGLVGKTIRVGSYSVRVDALLAEGGFATVYRVQDVTTQKMLALKHARMGGDPEAIAHVKKEVAIMKVLRGGANILTLRSVAFSGPTNQETEAFMVMDLCDGTLVNVLDAAQGTLPDKAILKIIADVCSALAHMHGQNPPIAHRDLKAENVMLHSSGDWLLCDFGSATNATLSSPTIDAIGLAEDDIRRHTTPSHRAPELWDLYSRVPIDHRVDLWALGCLLYNMAYGQLPFPAEGKLQVLNGEYSLPSSRGPAIASIVHDLLQVHPDDRPDVQVLLRRVRKALDDESSPRPQQHTPTQHQQPAAATPAISADESRLDDDYSPPLATFAAFDAASQHPPARAKPPPYAPKASPAAPPPYAPKSQPATLPERAPSPAQRPAPAVAPAARSSSTPQPGRQHSGGGGQPPSDSAPDSAQSRICGGGGATAASDTVQQAQELQSLRRRLAELQQQAAQRADAERGLRAQLDEAQLRQRHTADTVAQQRELIQRLRKQAGEASQAQLSDLQKEVERLSGLVVKQRELVQELRTKLSDSSQPQAESQEEVERLSETVVKQRELIQELRAKLNGGAQPQLDEQQEVQRLLETVVKQRELIQQLRAQQGDGAERLQQENQQLTDMVMKQRELIQQLRAQAAGTPTPPEQVGNGTPGWAAMDVAQTTTTIEEIVDGQRTVVLEIFQHLSVDGPASRDTPPPAGPAQAQRAPSFEPQSSNPFGGSSNPFAGSGFESSTVFTPTKTAGPGQAAEAHRPTWQN